MTYSPPVALRSTWHLVPGLAPTVPDLGALVAVWDPRTVGWAPPAVWWVRPDSDGYRRAAARDTL